MVADESGTLPLPWLAQPLASALAHPAHALLVVAGPGVGALSFQLTLAQAWLCEGTGAGPCGACASCRLVRARTHPDLQVLVPEALRVELGWDIADEGGEGSGGKRKPSRQIRIGDVRNATDWLMTSNSRGRAKVLVVHPAQAINLQAANALLKTLEEPPAGVRMVLSCGDAERLMPTVRSRCQRLDLPCPTAEVATTWLERQGVETPEVLLAANSGRPLDALAMFKAGVTSTAWLAVPRAIAAGQADAIAGWSLAGAVDALQKLCHDALAMAVGGDTRYFPKAAMPVATRVTALNQWAADLRRAAENAEHPLNEALQIEALVSQAHKAWLSGREEASRFATLRG